MINHSRNQVIQSLAFITTPHSEQADDYPAASILVSTIGRTLYPKVKAPFVFPLNQQKEHFSSFSS